MVHMNEYGSWALDFRYCEQLKAINDMKGFESWA